MSINIFKKTARTGNLSVEASLYIDERKRHGILTVLIYLLLVTAGVYGTIFSFLSCVEVPGSGFAAGICVITASFFMTFVFSMKKKLFTAALSITLTVYAVVLFYLRRQICAGFFNTANIYLAKSVSKYRTQSFVELISSENAAADTQIFVLMFIILLALVFAYGIVYRNNFFPVFLFSAPVLLLCLYYGFVPDYPAFISFIACYAGMIAVNMSMPYTLNSKPYKKASAQCGIIAFAVMLACFLAAFLYVRLTGYERPASVTELNSSIKNYTRNVSIEEVITDLTAINPIRIVKTGAIDHGRLGKDGNITFNNKTVLQVNIPKPKNTFYLRGFVGSVYERDRWEDFPAQKIRELENISAGFDSPGINVLLMDSYNLEAVRSADISKYSFSVKNIGASRDYLYMPYNLVPESVARYEITDYSHFRGGQLLINYLGQFYDPSDLYGYSTILTNKWTSSSPAVASAEALYRRFVYDNYLILPDSFKSADKVFTGEYYDFIGAEEPVGGKTSLTEMIVFSRKLYFIKKWLRDNCEYSLAAGKLPDGKDFVDYFITENRMGSCSHFASAAVLLCRYAGIPARYVEGYVIKPNDFSESTPFGTAQTVNVTDAGGHAWVEIYISGYGWYPMEFTSGYGFTQTAVTTADETEAETAASGEDTGSSESNITESVTGSSVQTDVTSGEATESITGTQASSADENTDMPAVTGPADGTGQNTVQGSGFKAEEYSRRKKTSPLSPPFNTFLIIAGVLILTVLGMLARRFYIIKKFHINAIDTKDIDKAAGVVYGRFKKLLKLLRLPGMSDMTYADYVKELSEASPYMSDGTAEAVIRTALKASFDELPLTRGELNEMYYSVLNIIKRYYGNSNLFKKLYIRYFLCLI